MVSIQHKVESPPLVSVWMITFNQARYISEALDSILAQKVNFSYEIVIGEDCSLDATREILLKYEKAHPDKFTLLFHNKNKGMIENQNQTFEACQGEYIAMLEGDDFWSDANKLQKQVDIMRQYPSCDLSFHPVNTSDGRILTRYAKKIKIFSAERCIEVGGFFCSTPSIMLRKTVAKRLPDFLDNAPAGDYYMQVFGSLRGGALYIPSVMATYRNDTKGSWSESVAKTKGKIDFLSRTLDKIIKMDQYLGCRYTVAFQKRYQKASLSLATTYLTQNNMIKFKKTMATADDYIESPTINFSVIKKASNFPKLILFLVKIHAGLLSLKFDVGKYFGYQLK